MPNSFSPLPISFGERVRALALFPQSLSSLPIPIGEVFTEVVTVEDVSPPGAHYADGPLQGLIMLLTLHGQTTTTIAGKQYYHHPGTLIIIPPHTDISEQVSQSNQWHVLLLMLSGSWADQLTEFLLRQERSAVVIENISSHWRQAFTEMTQLIQLQMSGWQWRFISLTADLFGYIYAEIISTSPGDQMLLKLGALIDGEPEKRPTVAELASAVGLTSRQLLYEFRKAANKPIAQWIRERRVATAQKLLGQGQSVSAVAEQLGFANLYHFSRVFKAVTGVAPSVIRSSALQAGLYLRRE